MPSQFLSIRESYSNSDFTIVADSGGSTTTATNLNLYILGKNRAGFNRVSGVTSLTVNPGQKLVVIFNSSIRESGEDLHQLIVAAENTGNPIDAVVLAAYNTKNADQITDRALPATLELTTDEHLAINATVSDLNSFPTSPLNGNIREVTSEAAFYQYNGELLQWEQILTNSAYVTTTLDLGGADRPLSLVENPLVPPDTNANTFSTPIKIAFFNGLEEDGGASLQAGNQFNLLLSVNGQETINGIGYNNLFGGFVRITFLGYVRRLTGALNVGLDTVGTPLVWFPNKGIISLPADLPRGYGAAWEISINVDSDRAGGLVPNNSIVTFNLYDQGLIGIPSDIGRVTGDVIFNEGDRARIVPNKRLGGVAVIGGSAQVYYLTPTLAESNLFGILSDAADQQIAISALLGGRVFVRASGATLQPSEALRAIVSTETGIYTASSYSNTVTLTANQSVRVTVTLPVDGQLEGTIRSNYPDVIAGTSNVIFNPPALIPYLETNGTIYEFPPVTVVPAATIDFSLDSLANGTIVTSLPTSPSPDFGLFDYGSLTAVADPSGSLAAGDYRVSIAWSYSSPNFAITKISHSTALGCIPEFSQTLSELLAQASRSFTTDANSIADIQNIPASTLATNPVVILNVGETDKRLYGYFQNFAGTIDEDVAITANNGTGAFVLIGGSSGGGTTPPPTTTQIEVIPFSELLFSPSGQLLFAPDGTILLASASSIIEIDDTSDRIVELNQLLLSPTGSILVSPGGEPLVIPEVTSSDPLVFRKSDIDSLLLSPSGEPLVSPNGEFLTT